MAFGDASFQAAARFFGGLVLGDLAPVVVAAEAGIARLGDGGDVDGGVELAVASSGQSVGLLLAAGDVDRRGAGVAGVVLLVGEAPDVAGEGEDLRRGEEPDPWISVRVLPLAVTAARSCFSRSLMDASCRLAGRARCPGRSACAGGRLRSPGGSWPAAPTPLRCRGARSAPPGTQVAQQDVEPVDPPVCSATRSSRRSVSSRMIMVSSSAYPVQAPVVQRHRGHRDRRRRRRSCGLCSSPAGGAAPASPDVQHKLTGGDEMLRDASAQPVAPSTAHRRSGHRAPMPAAPPRASCPPPPAAARAVRRLRPLPRSVSSCAGRSRS